MICAARSVKNAVAKFPTPKIPTGSISRQNPAGSGTRDRKSTRLNSSHLVISYAVFCLKKKKHKPALPLLGRGFGSGKAAGGGGCSPPMVLYARRSSGRPLRGRVLTEGVGACMSDAHSL